MRQRISTTILSILGAIFCYAWISFSASLFVFTEPDIENSSSAESVAPLTFLEICGWQVIVVGAIMLFGGLLYSLLIQKQYWIPRWWIPVTATVLISVAWVGVIQLYDALTTGPYQSIMPPERTGALLMDIFLAAVVFFLILLAVLPKRKCYGSI